MAEKVIRWSNAAPLDVDEVCTYVSQKKPENAYLKADKIKSSLQGISEDPYIGRKRPEYNKEHLRERIIDGFRLLYRIHPEAIEIVGVFSGRNRLPKTI